MARDDVDSYKKYLAQYYDSKKHAYDSTYTGEGRYRSNYFRLKTALRLLLDIKPMPEKILEAGCGNGRVIVEAIENGFNCVGFDNSDGMLAEAQRTLLAHGIDPKCVKKGDIYEMPYEPASFDAILCLGVIQNLPNHPAIFSEFRRVLKPDGVLIASVTNELFSLFSMNKYTITFLREIYRDIGLPEDIREKVLDSTSRWLGVDGVESVKVIMADEEVNKGHMAITKYNPLSVRELFETYDFRVEEIRFYHYHPVPPRFEKQYPSIFNSFAERLETIKYDWRGAILCNAMLIQARVAG